MVEDEYKGFSAVVFISGLRKLTNVKFETPKPTHSKLLSMDYIIWIRWKNVAIMPLSLLATNAGGTCEACENDLSIISPLRAALSILAIIILSATFSIPCRHVVH